jgi:hypothetical protein
MPLSVQAQYSRTCTIINGSCYNGSIFTWTFLGLTTTKFKPHVFPVSGFNLSNVANICKSSQSQSRSYVTTDSQSANLSWYQASIWGLRPDFYYCQTAAGLLMWGALSDERVIYNCAAPRHRSHSWVLSPAGLVTIFYCLRFETPPTWRARSPYSYPPGTGWPSYTPRHWVWRTLAKSQSQRQSYIATDGRSVSKSWCRAPSGAHFHDFVWLLLDGRDRRHRLQGFHYCVSYNSLRRTRLQYRCNQG